MLKNLIVICLLVGLLPLTKISDPKFTVAQRVLTYGKPAIIEKVEISKKIIYHTHLIHAAMFGDGVVKEPFYLVRFEQPENESDLFGDFDPEYQKELAALNREFKTILAPERALCPR
jgi:hypothetical protein